MTADTVAVCDQNTYMVNASLGPRWVRRLASRTPLALDPARPFAIKRNVHEVEVDADPDALGRALGDVVADPVEALGRIRVRRRPDRVGRPFEAGERFHGALTLGGAAAGGPLARLVRWLEDAFFSDYAEVERVSDREVRYRYLSGTPIAGSSTLRIEPAGPARSRLVVVFEFQEVAALALGALHRFALKRHDEAIQDHVRKAAARLGARVLRSTIRYA